VRIHVADHGRHGSCHGRSRPPFRAEDYFVPELLLAARAMKAAMVLIRPLLVASGAKSIGRVAVGTVKGDLHDIGKNLVASMLEAAAST